MISIIICSRTEAISKYLLENIKNTIGCDYELIVIDNSQSEYSIFEAYNIGIKKSKGNYWCFMHDDICIHTKNWGNILIDIFNKNQKIGLIGVAGSKMKTKMPSAWWNCPENQQVINILQYYPDRDKEKIFSGFEQNSNVEVVVIDGVFMLARKDNSIKFDNSITGFHNYDLNISFEYKRRGYKIFVTNQVAIEHYSTGNTSREWFKSTYRIHNKYKNFLPLQCDSSIKKENEIFNAVKFIEQGINYKTYRIVFLTWFQLLKVQTNFKWHLKFLKRILFKK